MIPPSISIEGRNRDVAEAAKRLKHAATSSTNSELKPAFEAYLALEEAEREALLAQVYVIPSQPDAVEITEQLQSELYHVSLNHQALSVQMLEGWWFKRVLNELVRPEGGIPRAEIDAQISDIQESLKPDALPIDEDLDALMVALEQLPEFADRPFYKQVELVTVANCASATRSPAICRPSGNALPGPATTCCSMPTWTSTTSACRPNGSCSTAKSATSSARTLPMRQWHRRAAPS